MDTRNMRHIASATESALAQLDLATVAVQATGLGCLTPTLQKDIADLMAVHDRLAQRLKAVTQVPADVL